MQNKFNEQKFEEIFKNIGWSKTDADGGFLQALSIDRNTSLANIWRCPVTGG